MCLYPRIIKNRKYTSTKKNGGNVPAISDQRVKYVPTGCQQCIECRKQKAREWQVRLMEDIKKHKNGKFITLTFSNESITELIKEIDTLEGYELDNQIAIKAMRLFNERWRKKYKKAIRHFMVTELGHEGTENIHLHGIVWTNETYETIESIWKYGFIWPRPDFRKKTWVNEQTVNYMIKYIYKMDELHKTYKSRILTSPGIGANYLEGQDWKKRTYNGKKTDETYKTRTGHKIAMPTYWRNKIYSEEEREQLWLNKLDKEERWICGIKISIKQGEKAYYDLLKIKREENKKLGYGDDIKDWSREQYEKERRILMMKQRTNTKTPSAGSNQKGSD